MKRNWTRLLPGSVFPQPRLVLFTVERASYPSWIAKLTLFSKLPLYIWEIKDQPCAAVPSKAVEINISAMDGAVMLFFLFLQESWESAELLLIRQTVWKFHLKLTLSVSKHVFFLNVVSKKFDVDVCHRTFPLYLI